MKLKAGAEPLALRAIVLLDGVKQDMCAFADDERGFVDVYVKPVQARYSAPSTLCRHRLFGVVKIIDPEDVQTLTDVYSR